MTDKKKEGKKNQKANRDAHGDMYHQKRSLLQGKVRTVRNGAPTNRSMGLGFWDSIPFMPIKTRLETPYAQHIFKRIQFSLSVNTYLVEVYPAVQSWKHNERILECMQILIQASEEKFTEMIRESEDQTKEVLAALGLDDSSRPHYVNTIEITYGVTTPRVKRFLDHIKRLDDQIVRLDTLWMADGGADQNHVRHESLRLRGGLQRYASSIFRQSDRIRRVIRNRCSTADILKEVEDEVDKHYGRGLKTEDESGNSMLIEGEQELTGPLVGEKEDANDETMVAPKPPPEQVAV